MNKEKIKEFLKEYENKLLVLLMLFAVIIRIHYFFKVGEQPIWWDEGDYLAVGKGLIHGWENQEWWTKFTGIRPMLMPLIWGFFFLINSSELIMRFFTFKEVMSFVIASPRLLKSVIGREVEKNRLGDSLKRIFVKNA